MVEAYLHPIRVVHYGLGAIGSSIARLTAAQRGVRIVGGIERDPAKVGRDVGDVIGLSGNTGLSTGAHLHWELSIYGIAVDPLQFTEQPLRAPQ